MFICFHHKRSGMRDAHTLRVNLKYKTRLDIRLSEHTQRTRSVTVGIGQPAACWQNLTTSPLFVCVYEFCAQPFTYITVQNCNCYYTKWILSAFYIALEFTPTLGIVSEMKNKYLYTIMCSKQMYTFDLRLPFAQSRPQYSSHLKRRIRSAYGT